MTKASEIGGADRAQTTRENRRGSAVNAACEQILRPICEHFLDLGVGISQFLHVAKLTYVRAAAAAIRETGQRPTVSRVAAATGLQRKEVSHLIGASSGHLVFNVREAPTMRVVSAWRQRKEYRDAVGKPRPLPIEGEGSFKELVDTYAGDVTHVALLRELERLSWARRTESGLVALKATQSDLKRKHAESELLASRLADFASAIVSSGRSAGLQHYASFRESQPADVKIGAALTRTFSRRAEDFLDGFDRWVSRSVRQSGGGLADATQFGIGIYLIEKRAKNGAKVGPTPKPRRTTPRAKRA